MKIRTLIMLLMLVAVSIAYSTAIQTDSPGTKEKAGKPAETPAVVDITRIPLQKGTHEVYRDKESGVIFSRTVTEKVSYSAIDKNGKPVALLPMPSGCGYCVQTSKGLLCIRSNYCYKN